MSNPTEIIGGGADPLILIVDDVAANRLVLGALLRKAGYKVVSAGSAHHALQQIALQIPDLILLDIMMPGIDGYTLCRRLRAETPTAKVPIIFLSSLDEAVDKVKAFESGGADYVTKPFQVEEVLARVAHQLKIARLQRDLEHEKAELVRKNLLLLAAQRKTAMVFNSLTEILPGFLLDGKYRIEDKIGSGGFGVVYRAIHVALNRAVALKVFRPPGNGSQPDALSRFQLEGISACRVSHPNAVMVLDSGISAQGIAYLVMELLDGPTLYFEMLRRRQLSVRRTLQIVLPICDVLIAAHAAGIIHRDVKPDAATANPARRPDRSSRPRGPAADVFTKSERRPPPLPLRKAPRKRMPTAEPGRFWAGLHATARSKAAPSPDIQMHRPAQTRPGAAMLPNQQSATPRRGDGRTSADRGSCRA